MQIGSTPRFLGGLEHLRAILIDKRVVVAESDPAAVLPLFNHQKIAIFQGDFYEPVRPVSLPARRICYQLGGQGSDSLAQGRSYSNPFGVIVSDLIANASYAKVSVLVDHDQLVTASYKSVFAHVSYPTVRWFEVKCREPRQ
jgi:hypothetical protein